MKITIEYKKETSLDGTVIYWAYFNGIAKCLSRHSLEHLESLVNEEKSKIILKSETIYTEEIDL